jgi:hypothetical protein
MTRRRSDFEAEPLLDSDLDEIERIAEAARELKRQNRLRLLPDKREPQLEERS